MKTVEESVVMAMDGTDKELFPFLPYILQDIWEFGADPGIIVELIRNHMNNYSHLKLLDLGCGKGPVSVKAAREFNLTCHGIDAMKEFIREAKNKAKEYGVDHLCKFEVADIRERINALPQYDIIILGAIGPVFGNYYSTLTTVTKNLNKNGIVILDDGYIKDDSDFTHPLIQKQGIILKQIKDSGAQLIDEVIIGQKDIKEADEYIFEKLKKRCMELMKKYPGKRTLFENYIKKQEEENDVLETKIVCSTMVIKSTSLP